MSWTAISFIFIIVWWLTLFTVLPISIRRIDRPLPGHSVGAPANPALFKRALATTLLAILFTWLIVTVIHFTWPWIREASAQEEHWDYTASGPCEDMPVDYKPSPDIAYKPDTDASGRVTVPADVHPSPLPADAFNAVDIGVALPVDKYVDTKKYNADLSDTRVFPGDIHVENGKASLNGADLTPAQPSYPLTTPCRKK